MPQQGQVFELKTSGSKGRSLWAYRYRSGGRGSRRTQRGGFTSEKAATEALARALDRLRREQGLVEAPTLSELVDLYLAQHGGEPETVAKLRWLLAKAVRAFGHRRINQLRPAEIATWRMTIAGGHRFEATQALRQVLGRAVSWGLIDANPAKQGIDNPQRRYTEKRPFESWAELEVLAAELGRPASSSWATETSRESCRRSRSPRCWAATAPTWSFRKLHTRVAAFRQYLRAKAANRAEEELLAAKIVGRWPSGAPLMLAPEQDDPELGDDPARSNDFLYEADDPRGLKCPLGAHARRMNPRDASIIGVVRLHHMTRRSTSYGPMLPEGVLEDDGAERGIIFVAGMANLDRQFEFVKTQWINQGLFFRAPTRSTRWWVRTTAVASSPSPNGPSGAA